MEEQSNDLKQIISSFIKNPYRQVFFQSIIILIPIVIMVLGVSSGLQLFLNDFVKSYDSFSFMMLLPFCFIIFFVLLFLYSIFSSIKMYKIENRRYLEYINNSEIVNEWITSKSSVYNKSTTQIWESKNYIFVFENDTQGPFIFHKSNLENLKVIIQRPKRNRFSDITLEISFKLKNSDDVFYILDDRYEKDLENYSGDPLFSFIKSMAKLASKSEVKISKDSESIKYIHEISEFIRK